MREKIQTRHVVASAPAHVRPALFGGLLLAMIWWAAPAHAELPLRLQCGKLGMVTLSNQFTLITYGDGTTSKRVNLSSRPLLSAQGASSVNFIDGTVVALRTSGGSEYTIQKSQQAAVDCTRK